MLLAHLPALVLLVSAVVGVAGELAGVATSQPRVTGKVTSALGEFLPNVFVSNDSLKLKCCMEGLRKAYRDFTNIYLFIQGMFAAGFEQKTGVNHLPSV